MKQMLIRCQEQLTQTAVLENGQLTEFYMEETTGRHLVGNIYKGRVVNVLPGMQAAFVDIGQGKNAFLYVDDLLPPHLEQQPKEKPPIASLVKPGQTVIVQVSKEALGGKGARVTTHYALPGRYLVYMPLAGYIGVSKKIGFEQERERLKQLAGRLKTDEEGVILRTVASEISEQELHDDLLQLRSEWREISSGANDAEAPAELHSEAGFMQRMVRDLLNAELDEVWISRRQQYEEAVRHASLMAPQLKSRIRFYNHNDAELFRKFGVQDQLESAFGKRVRLPSGSDLVWEQTEALTVIDVNTGKYTGHLDLENTVFRTNMEAAFEIARLLRLRDAGGIIIIDFIDMELEEHREQVKRELEKLTARDRTTCHVVGWTRLGLLEMTRKKGKENVESRLYETCGACQGKGKLLRSF
ncbi:Rne/Rng family ribonuclease [Paenibacillus sp. GCM10012307]|uniref:Rne/Rng family ribonuclease n=1 Tax=Paenibacillus roseus TaxID=2798579 RepID=A0A934MRI7_9BACL|nr:Rne/Rng family ribonuclease [Paenibacillus roseus]MBJ6362933.1 Rne/Rng family ribonuclease [Paenibacillus roseus]